MRHKHHLVPKYLGGSDDPSNLVEVSVTQHAMFHFCNWQLCGNEQDRIAWMGLSKQISEQEAIHLACQLGGRSNLGKTKNPEHKSKISQTIRELMANEENRKRISLSMSGNKNSQSQKSPESRKKHSEIMKAAWQRRKMKTCPINSAR
jgi:hypothetical protein